VSEEASGTGDTACPFCESQISAAAKKCRYCSEWVSRDCLICGTPIRGEWAARGRCAPCQGNLIVAGDAALSLPPHHDRGTAGLLALFLGAVGAHKFYLGKPGQGLLYLVFCWTFIPALIGLIEGVTYLASSDESFQAKYG